MSDSVRLGARPSDWTDTERKTKRIINRTGDSHTALTARGTIQIQSVSLIRNDSWISKMADCNSHGDDTASGANHDLSTASESQPGDNSLHNRLCQVSQLMTTQSKELMDLVGQLKLEQENSDKKITEKDEEIRKLKDDLQQVKTENEELKDQVKQMESDYDELKRQFASGVQVKTPIFPSMKKGDDLHKFIDDTIRPDRTFNTQCNKIIDKLVRSLQSKESPFPIKRIEKCGSLGKGTHVRNKSDIDLIIFFNGYNSVQDLQERKADLLQRLKDYIMKYWSDDVWFKEVSVYSIQFFIKIEDDKKALELDLLPALDLTQSGRSLADIYEEMKKLPAQDRGAYSSCLAPLQVKFVTATGGMSTPGNVKDLIRLLKHWAKEEEVPVKAYCLELLVIQLWRDSGKPTKINMHESLRRILQQLVDVEKMEVHFEDNYTYTDYAPQQKKWFVLDPANPFRNVAPSKSEADSVVTKAKGLLERLG